MLSVRNFFFATIFLVLLVIPVNAQSWLWRSSFNGFFDNREYFNDYVAPRTMFGSRISAETGFLADDNNRFLFGLDFLYEFGSRGELLYPDITMYFQHKGDFAALSIGAFPRRDIAKTPRMLLNDTINYYRPNIEGLYLGFDREWGYLHGWLDWTSRQSDTKRETFMVRVSARQNIDIFFLQQDLLMYHFAGTAIHNPDDHLRDNGGILAVGGIRPEIDLFEKTEAYTGIALSYDRARGLYDLSFKKGWYSALALQFRRLGFSGSYFRALSPPSYNETNRGTYYEGMTVMTGDGFYKAKEYGRLDFFLIPIETGRIRSKVSFSLHLIPGILDFSQQFTLYIDIEGRKKLKGFSG